MKKLLISHRVISEIMTKEKDEKKKAKISE